MGGLVAGRRVGVEVWGPSGATPEVGTENAIDKTIEALNWDIARRRGRPPAPACQRESSLVNYALIRGNRFFENACLLAQGAEKP